MSNAPLKRHVALIGFMGCGKSTIGPILAKRLGVPFVDTDERIVAEAGRSIPTIFRDDGEAAFRALETASLRRVLDEPPQVIATGGGLVTQEVNWELLMQRSIPVWLRVPFASLQARLEGSEDRPLLQDDPGFERTRRLYSDREPLYARAPLHIDATAAPEAVAEAIVRQLTNREPAKARA